MEKEMTAIISVAIALGMAGCKSPCRQGMAGSPCCATDQSIQIAALSNQVSLLSRKVDSMEQEWQRVEPLMRRITQLWAEQVYQPVVHQEMVGDSTNETKPFSPNKIP